MTDTVVSTRPPLMANQELAATTGGASSIAIVGSSGFGISGTTNSRCPMIEPSSR